jgi:hypothetical protein
MNQPPPESLRVHGRFDAFYKSLLEEKKKKKKKKEKRRRREGDQAPMFGFLLTRV